MIKHSFSGTSLTLVVLMFLSSIGGCAKLISKCSHSAETASHALNAAKNVEKVEELANIEKSMTKISKLFQSYRVINLNKSVTMNLPEITKRIDDTRSYDNIYQVKDEANHFFINTKSEPKTEKSSFEQWVKFRQIAFSTKSILRCFIVYDSLNFYDSNEGVQTKAYKYCQNNDTIQGMVKLIETPAGFTFIEMETPATNKDFYEFSELFFKTALVVEPKNIAHNIAD